MKSTISSVEAPDKKCTLVCLLLFDSLGTWIWFSMDSPAIITSILPLALVWSSLDGFYGWCFFVVGGLGRPFSALFSFCLQV